MGMKRYLLDTNICISILKNRYGIREKITQIGLDSCCISEITVAELFYGAAKSGLLKHYEDVANIIRMFDVIPMYSSLKTYGIIKSDLERIGQRLDDFDLLIGATAIHHKMIMVTSNTKHFERIPNIQTEDWARS